LLFVLAVGIFLFSMLRIAIRAYYVNMSRDLAPAFNQELGTPICPRVA
jgi:hypothetical protein